MPVVVCSPPGACRGLAAVLEAAGYMVSGEWRGRVAGLVAGEGCSCSLVRRALRVGLPVLAVGVAAASLARCLKGGLWRLACLPEYCGAVAAAGAVPVYAPIQLEDPVLTCIEAYPECIAEFIRMLRSHRLLGRVMWFTRGYPCRDGR